MAQGDKLIKLEGMKAVFRNIGAGLDVVRSDTYPGSTSIVNQLTDVGYFLSGSAATRGQKTAGSGSSASLTAVSPYIPMQKGDVIKMTNWKAGTSQLVCAFYTAQDESTYVQDLDGDNVPKAMGAGASKMKAYTYTCPQDGYIRIGCSRINDIQTNGSTAVIYNAIGDINDRVAALEAGAAAMDTDITALETYAAQPFDLLKYVSSNGSDAKDGNTASNAYATIAKALEAGATIIRLAPGTYTELVASSSDKPVKIFGYGAEFNLDMTGLTENKIVFDFRTSKSVEIYGITVNITGTAGTYTSGNDTKTYSFTGFLLSNCAGALVDCTVNGGSNSGFRLDGSKVTLTRCSANGCGVDGFNAHDTGTSVADGVLVSGGVSEGTFIDCAATGCGDDGLSYHDNGIMHVFGGQYTGNTCTGIAPHHNCNCEIHNAYVAGNGRAGIEALYGAFNTSDPNNPETTYHDPLPTMIMTGCVLENNVGDAVTAEHYIVKAGGNLFEGNGTDGIVNGGSAEINAYDPVIDLKGTVENLQREIAPRTLAQTLRKPSGMTISVDVGIDSFGNLVTSVKAADGKNPVSVAVWVDPDNGLDTNDGTEEHPYKTCTAALAHTDVDTIYLKAGLYDAETGLIGKTITNPINLIGIGEVYMTGGATCDETFTARGSTSGANKLSNLSAAAVAVFDTKVVDSRGHYERLILNSSSSDIPRGYFYKSGKNIWVDCSDGRSLSGKTLKQSGIIVITSSDNLLSFTDAGNVYIENIRFLYTQVKANSTGSTRMKLWCKNCWFYESLGGTGGIAVRSVDSVYEDCTANFNKYDGFSYHTDNMLPGKALEINCTGAWNGTNDSNHTSDNGSTAHNYSEIIRLDGKYHHNCGGNIADTGSTKSWNIRCQAWDSLAENTDGDGYINNADFWLKAGGFMYNYLCSSPGSSSTYNAWDVGASMYNDECDFARVFTDEYNNVQAVYEAYDQLNTDQTAANHGTLLAALLDKMLTGGLITPEEYSQYITLA